MSVYPVLGVLYVVFLLGLAVLVVWILILLISFLRLKNAELRAAAARRESE
ncbi:hypothetical protein [Arthrobacter sp. NPDC089319]|uniref:hypothetical protein n=1 Tax=Arthrobacter sp. NPDC089319 TaxID=3155915 RepID=UPI0034294B94